MHKFFGIVFLVAGIAAGFATWFSWRELQRDKTHLIFMPGLAMFCLYFLIVGVEFMRGRNPLRNMWRRMLDDD